MAQSIRTSLLWRRTNECRPPDLCRVPRYHVHLPGVVPYGVVEVSVVQNYDGMQVELPRKGLDSYPPVARKVLEAFIARKAREGCDRLTIIRVMNPEDPRTISVYFSACQPALPDVYARGTYGGPHR